MANQVSPIPPYPYTSYTVITPMIANNGTYGAFVEEIDGKKVTIHRKEFQQVWSFTVQADDDAVSKSLAFKLYDFFDRVGTVTLNEAEIVVQRLGNITNRDNLISINYEYRNGLDVTFAFMNEVEETLEEIDKFTINNK